MWEQPGSLSKSFNFISFFNSGSDNNSYQQLAVTTPLMGCISLYWSFVVGNIFCSHLNFKKEGRYNCVVGTNNTDLCHMPEIVFCNPDLCEVTVSSCSSAAYSASYISTHVCHTYMTFLYYITFFWVYSDSKVYIVLHIQYLYRAISTTQGPKKEENTLLSWTVWL